TSSVTTGSSGTDGTSSGTLSASGTEAGTSTETGTERPARANATDATSINPSTASGINAANNGGCTNDRMTLYMCPNDMTAAPIATAAAPVHMTTVRPPPPLPERISISTTRSNATGTRAAKNNAAASSVAGTGKPFRAAWTASTASNRLAARLPV